MSQTSSSRPFARPHVSVAVDDTPPPGMPSPGRLIDTMTPKTRRVSKLPQAERSYALEVACRCVEHAYQAREGPAIAHAAHLRADGYKVLKKALYMKDDQRTAKEILEHSGEDSVTSATESDALSDTATTIGCGFAKQRRPNLLWHRLQQFGLSSAGDRGLKGPSLFNSIGPPYVVQQCAVCHADTAATVGCSPAKQRRSNSLWRRVQQFGLSSAGDRGSKGPSPFKASPTRSPPGGTGTAGRPPVASPQSDGPRRKTTSSAAHSANITADTRSCYSDVPPRSSAPDSAPQKALDTLFLAAPVKGEVQPWVWLLRTMADTHQLDSVHDCICYLAKIVKYIAAEEEWLRLLVHELTPVIQHLHADELPLNAMRALERVADKALQLGEAALCKYRNHSSSQCKNAALLHYAVKLISLLTSCGLKADDSSLGEIIETHLNQAAHARYRNLKATIGKPRGQAMSPGARPSAAEEALQGQLIVTEQLVMDVTQDEEVYQQAFPSTSSISLATVSCRVFCQLLRPDLDKVLALQPPVRGSLLDLFYAVHHLEKKARKLFPPALGPEGVFVDDSQRPLFLPHIDEYLSGVQGTLTEWTDRSLEQERWQCSGTQVMCTASLVDAYSAMANAAEEHWGLAAAHPLYAALLEKVLAEVARQHIMKLEILAQDLLPAPPSPNKRLLAKTQQQQQPEPWLPSQKLCAVLSDMREARQKQLEVAETLRGGVPRRWWGAQMGSGQPKLGSRMQIIQGDTDRRYAMLLSQTVKRMMASVAPVLGYALDAGAAESPGQAAVYPGHRLMAVESVLCHRIEHLRPLMDPRVLRRAAKDLWNSCAGSLGDRLLSKAPQGDSAHAESLGDVGPRLQSADALQKGLADWFVRKANVGLVEADEPEKARKLTKTLSAFLHVGHSGGAESLDV